MQGEFQISIFLQILNFDLKISKKKKAIKKKKKKKKSEFQWYISIEGETISYKNSSFQDFYCCDNTSLDMGEVHAYGNINITG